MMTDSVITRTGQLWKFVLAVALLLAGSFLPLVEGIGMTWTAGTIVACVGYGLALAFIQCPACNVRWFWKALMYAEIYVPLIKKPECPVCKQQFHDS